MPVAAIVGTVNHDAMRIVTIWTGDNDTRRSKARSSER